MEEIHTEKEYIHFERNNVEEVISVFFYLPGGFSKGIPKKFSKTIACRISKRILRRYYGRIPGENCKEIHGFFMGILG